MPDLTFEIINSIVLVCVGIFSILRKHISIGIGRPPIFNVGITASRAILFGCVSLLAGIIPLLLMFLTRLAPDSIAIEQGTLSIVIGAGMIVTFLTFLFELFIE